MTISTTTNRVQYSGTGSQTAFSFPYYVESASDLSVYVTTSAGVETLQTISTHYTVSGPPSASNTITFVTAPASTETVTIVRDEPLVQEVDVSGVANFRAQGFEDNFDRLVRMTQRIWEKLGRAVVFQASSTSSDVVMPELEAGKYLKVDSAGTGFDFATSTGYSQAGAWATATAYSESDVVTNNGSSYIATSAHTSGASTEPGTGGSWTTVWQLVASKGDTGAAGSGAFSFSDTTVTADRANDYIPLYDGSDSNAEKKAALTDWITTAIAASTSNGEGAALIGIEDSATAITATTVEGALAEVWTTFVKLAGGTMSGNLTLADNQIIRANLLDYGVVTNAIGSIGGGTQDIDLTSGNSVTATVDTSTTTFTFSNPTASDEWCGFVLGLTNGGSQTVNWPASVDWAGGTAPTLTTAGVDWLVFWTVDGGTIWNGSLVGADFQ